MAPLGLEIKKRSLRPWALRCSEKPIVWDISWERGLWSCFMLVRQTSPKHSPPKFFEGKKSQPEWCGTMFWVKNGRANELLQTLRLYGRDLAEDWGIGSAYGWVEKFTDSVPWLFICWAALVPLWAMEVWMRYAEVISWCKKIYVHNIYNILWYGLVWFTDLIVYMASTVHAGHVCLTRNYLSIGALKRQMVTVQKNEEVAWPLTATGCESNPWQKRGDYWWLLQLASNLAEWEFVDVVL